MTGLAFASCRLLLAGTTLLTQLGVLAPPATLALVGPPARSCCGCCTVSDSNACRVPPSVGIATTTTVVELCHDTHESGPCQGDGPGSACGGCACCRAVQVLFVTFDAADLMTHRLVDLAHLGDEVCRGRSDDPLVPPPRGRRSSC